MKSGIILRKHNGKQLYGIKKILTTLKMGLNADGLFISAYGRDMVSSGPKMLSCKILFAPKVLPCNVDGTFALYETDLLGNRIFGWNGNQHMCMI